MYETTMSGYSRFSRNRQDERKFDEMMGYEPSDDEIEEAERMAEEEEIREFHRELYYESLKEK